jgi:hypothetical protein
VPNILGPIHRPLSLHSLFEVLYHEASRLWSIAATRKNRRKILQRLAFTSRLQVGVVLVGEGHLSSVGHLLLVLLEELGVDLHLGRSESRGGNEFQLRVADKLASKPEERLLEVVVGLGGDVVVLEVLLAVEGDGLGLHLTLLHIDLVTGQDNGDVLADTDEVTVPVGNVLVGDTGGHIEHDHTALAVDIVTISETTELLLTSSVPHVELDGTQVGGESKRVDFDTESRNVLLFEFTSQVTLDEGGLSSTTVTDKHELEGRQLGWAVSAMS